MEILKEYPTNGNPECFITIHEGIGGWNSGLWVWVESDKYGDGFYEPYNTGFTNTSLGTGLREDAIREAKCWAKDEELPLYIPY